MPDRSVKRARTCVGCGRQSDKMELLRIVKAADGAISYDATGRKAGRGAYVCSLGCLQAAAKSKKLQRALRVNIGSEDVERIASEMSDAMRGEEIR